MKDSFRGGACRAAMCVKQGTRASSYLPVFLLLVLTAVGVSLLFHVIERRWVTFRRAEQRVAAGDYAAAADLYREAAQQGVESAQVYRGWGAALVHLQRFEEAREPLARAVHADPSDAGTVLQLAGVYQYLQQPEQALRVLEEFQAKGKPLTADAELQLARIHRQLQHYEKAESYYREIPVTHREGREARRELAEMLAWQQRYTEAIDLLTGLVEEDPKDTETRQELARVYGWAGKLNEAREQYRAILQE